MEMEISRKSSWNLLMVLYAGLLGSRVFTNMHHAMTSGACPSRAVQNI